MTSVHAAGFARFATVAMHEACKLQAPCGIAQELETQLAQLSGQFKVAYNVLRTGSGHVVCGAPSSSITMRKHALPFEKSREASEAAAAAAVEQGIQVGRR